MMADIKRDNLKTATGDRRASGRMGACALLAAATVLWLAATAGAQTVSFDQLVYARSTSALLEHDGVVIGGLEGGGLVLWQVADPSSYERVTSGPELSANDVTDLAWSGRNVWVATNGGGLTRITDVAGNRSFRQYASNLGSLNVTSVTGTLVGQSERVYYGMDGGGVGLINDGLSGAIYTAEQDGLISNFVTSLQVFDGDLFVATPSGVSRFASNVFTDQNTGLGSLDVNDLTLDGNGDLLAATAAGVFRWDAGAETWSLVGGQTGVALEVSCSGSLVYVRGTNSARVYNGTTWVTLTPPTGATGAIHAGTEFWLGGRAGISTGAEFTIQNAYLARRNGATTFDVFEVTASQVLSAGGVTFSDGAPYVGGQVWQSVISSRHDGVWEHVHHELATADNVDKRLSEGIILALATGADDDVWAALYAGTGLARLDRAAGLTHLINPTNSGLLGKSIVNVVTHPDGPVLTLHDWADAEKVEILVDPDNWADAGSWLTLPLVGGLGDGPSVWDAVVQRRDVIWFAVESVGVVRWDINGDAAGPDDPLTWQDQSDDRWDAPLRSVPGSVADLGAAFGLEVGSDGSLWVGGNGLVQFTYNEQTRAATLVTNLSEKASAVSEGLINANVSSLARDANGDIWVATANGLNRVRGTGQDVAVDTYVDLANYFANPNYAVLYSPNVISPLPGNAYRALAASADRRQILVSADQGASLLTIGRGGTGTASTETDAFVTPNPYLPAESAGLKLAGLPDGAEALVEIYTAEGQLVYRDRKVTPETVFWSGTNTEGVDVATGLYVVLVTSGGTTRTLTLAVVR